jgi:hypothetical protein
VFVIGKPNYKQIYAIKKKNEERILSVCPDCPNTSGIYFLLREEDGFKYAYIGQAKHILDRLASHLSGYQHIDLSIKKHGLWSEENRTGYKVHCLLFPEDRLDEKEQYYIKIYANAGWQMRNETTGSQGKGKKALGDAKTPKNYYDGIAQGEKNARKMVAHLFALHLDCVPKKNPPTKNQEKALQKFKEFLDVE